MQWFTYTGLLNKNGACVVLGALSRRTLSGIFFLVIKTLCRNVLYSNNFVKTASCSSSKKNHSLRNPSLTEQVCTAACALRTLQICPISASRVEGSVIAKRDAALSAFWPCFFVLNTAYTRCDETVAVFTTQLKSEVMLGQKTLEFQSNFFALRDACKYSKQTTSEVSTGPQRKKGTLNFSRAEDSNEQNERKRKDSSKREDEQKTEGQTS